MSKMPRLLILSSCALTDRILAHTDLLKELSQEAELYIWAMSARNPRFTDMWSSVPGIVQSFPEVQPFPAYPITFLRRINDFAWDFRLQGPSRMSMMLHIRDKSQPWWIRILKPPSRALAWLGLHEQLERRVEQKIIAYDRSADARERLATLRPDMVLTTGPFLFEEPAVAAAAKKLGIPVLAFITTWDNLTIKHRLVLRYEGYIVWSERMQQELVERYSFGGDVPVYITGAPQFDVFRCPEYFLTREQFCRIHRLVPELPVIVHALGVANGIAEHHGALDLARRVVKGELGKVQLLVRPHPFHNHLELRDLFKPFGPHVIVQQNGDPTESRSLRSQDRDALVEWINTFRHADVVVHLSSTAGIDAAMFDRPSVCMDYDPTPGQPRQKLVKEVNHLWTHYKPVAESGGMVLAGSPQELIDGIRAYLRDPGLHREGRKGMVKHVCGYADGQCSRRMARAISEFLVNMVGRCSVTSVT